MTYYSFIEKRAFQKNASELTHLMQKVSYEQQNKRNEVNEIHYFKY